MVSLQSLRITAAAFALSLATSGAVRLHAGRTDANDLFAGTRGRAKLTVMTEGGSTVARGKVVALYDRSHGAYYGVAVQNKEEDSYAVCTTEGTQDSDTLFSEDGFLSFLQAHPELQIRGVPGYLSRQKKLVAVASLSAAVGSIVALLSGKQLYNDARTRPVTTENTLIIQHNTAVTMARNILQWGKLNTLQKQAGALCLSGLALGGFGIATLISEVLLGRYTSVAHILRVTSAYHRQKA